MKTMLCVLGAAVMVHAATPSAKEIAKAYQDNYAKVCEFQADMSMEVTDLRTEADPPKTLHYVWKNGPDLQFVFDLPATEPQLHETMPGLVIAAGATNTAIWSRFRAEQPVREIRTWRRGHALACPTTLMYSLDGSPPEGSDELVYQNGLNPHPTIEKAWIGTPWPWKWEVADHLEKVDGKDLLRVTVTNGDWRPEFQPRTGRRELIFTYWADPAQDWMPVATETKHQGEVVASTTIQEYVRFRGGYMPKKGTLVRYKTESGLTVPVVQALVEVVSLEEKRFTNADFSKASNR